MANWSYEPDSFAASMVWGRIGAAILVLAGVILGAFGYTFGHEDQSVAYEAVSALLGSVGAIMAIVSKLREKKKTG